MSRLYHCCRCDALHVERPEEDPDIHSLGWASVSGFGGPHWVCPKHASMLERHLGLAEKPQPIKGQLTIGD